MEKGFRGRMRRGCATSTSPLLRESFRGWPPTTPDRQIAVPFVCECSEHRCEELIRLTLGQFDAARTESDYLVAPGHQVESARIVRVRDGLWLYRAELRSTPSR